MPRIKVRVLIVRRGSEELLRFEGSSKPLDAIEVAFKEGMALMIRERDQYKDTSEFALTTYVVEKEIE